MSGFTNGVLLLQMHIFSYFCGSLKQTAAMAFYQAAAPLSLLKVSLGHHYSRAHLLSSTFECSIS